MGSRLRCAVVGVGHLGKFHAQKYKALSNVDLVGVCDIHSETAQKVAADLGVPALHSYQDLLGKVDAVTIAASTTAHFELAKVFLEHGIHVHVEKPLTTTSTDGAELVKIARARTLRLQVGHVERFNPALIAARAQLQRPLFIECHRLSPFKQRSVDVDVVLDLMIHDLDVILSLVRSEPVSVSAVGTPVLTKCTDMANARIEFASGTIANVTASRVSQKSQRKFRVFQNSQYLSIDFGSGEVNLLTKTGDWKEGEIPLEAEAWSLEKGDALLDETRSFVESILENKECVVTGEDGLVALRLAEMINADIQRRLSKFEATL
jgi:predicted dehydrogenase